MIIDVNKKDLKEQEVRTMFISPALNSKGWKVPVNMREEYYFTAGRILVYCKEHAKEEGKSPQCCGLMMN